MVKRSTLQMKMRRTFVRKRPFEFMTQPQLKELSRLVETEEARKEDPRKFDDLTLDDLSDYIKHVRGW